MSRPYYFDGDGNLRCRLTRDRWREWLWLRWEAPVFLAGHRAVWLCGKYRKLPLPSGEAKRGSLGAYALSLALFACLLLVVITR